MSKLAFFICSPPGFPAAVNNRRNMTSPHPVLNCHAFKCEGFEQWQDIGKREVAASMRKLWMAVLIEHEDGTFTKPDADMTHVVDFLNRNIKVLASLPEAEGASPSPATNVADAPPPEPVEIVMGEVPASGEQVEKEEAQPEPAAATLNERIVAQIATKPLRIKELSEALGVPAAELKAEIENSSNLTLSGPGWVKLAE